MPKQAGNYRFGPYELRTRTRELYKQGHKVKLRPQPFQILGILAERAGDVVTREELRDLLWSKETFVDFEHGLNTAIKELRGVLNDSASDPRYIETLPKLGYRIIMPVEVDEATCEVHDAIAQPPATTSDDPRPGVFPVDVSPALRLRRWALALGIPLVILVALAVYFQWSRSRVRSPQAGGRVMLAVLPFENLTGDSTQEYFSDGLTEEMIAQVGRLDPQRLGVIARTSVMHYKNSREPLEQIGHELGVQYVLEGSVRRDADKVRVSAQLVQVKDQSPMWARQYDRELSKLLVLQAEIAQEIGGEIQITLGEPKRINAARETPLSPSAIEAHDLYLKGRYFWNKRTAEGFQRAVECFQQAVAKEPTYARAYAGLADSYGLMSSYSVALPKEVMPKARVAALRALELDDGLAEAHASLALIAQNYDLDWQTAEKEYRRAIELDPNYATAHHWYAEYLALMGRFDEAFIEIERARQLDPLSLIIATDQGAILYFSRQYDRAIGQLRTVLDMEPNFPRAHILAFAYVQKGMYAEGLADVEKWRRIDDSALSWMMLAYVYGRSGQQAKARAALRKLEELNRSREPNPLMIAVAHTGMGEIEEAITWLQKAYADHTISTALKVDPIYDPLRSDPRFQELLRRMKFPQ
jgi:TolB-like protein/DNA-binding winged helix-turn-helix (wHTH) protein/Tfp pilus assembly protein PilF